jgi:hypothetical protein
MRDWKMGFGPLGLENGISTNNFAAGCGIWQISWSSDWIHTILWLGKGN